MGRISLCIHKDAVQGKTGKTIVIIHKSSGEVLLVKQDIIENVSQPMNKSIIILFRKK